MHIINTRLQFSMEIGGYRINFLDTIIKNNYIIKNNKLIFDYHHKQTYLGRYLNFLSRYFLYQKRGTIFRLVDRMFILSHPSFHQKNLELIVTILLENDYPLNFIFKTISNRIRHLITNSNNKTQNDKDISHLDDKIINSWFVIQYFGSYLEKFRRV